MNMKKSLVSLAGIAFMSLLAAFAAVFAEENDQANQADPSPPRELVLSIQYGKGGSIQEFRLKSGEAVFVQTGKPQSPTGQPDPQAPATAAYQKQRGDISQKIADKITAIQNKQKDLDSEIFPAYRAPLALELQALERDLKLLETQRQQLESQQIAKEAQKPSQPPTPPPPTQVRGMTVRVSITGNSASLTMQNPDKQASSSTVQIGMNTWIQIFSAEKGQGQDIWAKVAPLGE